MKDAGITAPVPRGDWQGNVNYYFLNIVNHNGISWIAKRENLGQEPSDGLYWQRFGTSVPIATTSIAGIVKPDGTTISVGGDGTIEVKIDGESIFIDDEDDTIKAKLSTLADVDITDLADGYVLAWDATSETWVAVRQSSGLLPHLIIISETGESVVKAVKGLTEVIATETSTGHYECDVPEFGTWTIHAVLGGEDAQVSLVVDTVKVYTVDDSHFHADITVTYPSGAQVSCSKTGETTLYATGSPYTFTVHSAGTWTITGVLNGVTVTKNVTISTSGQTENVAFSHTISVDLYSAASDTVFFTDATGNKTATTDATGKAENVNIMFTDFAPSIMFISSVAKNPTNLSNNYSKSVTLTTASTEVDVMPDNVVYWYGNQVNSETISSANGWSNSYGYTMKDPTYNTNYVDAKANANNMISGIGSSTTMTGTNLKIVAQGTTLSGTAYGVYGTLTSKVYDYDYNQESLDSNALTLLTKALKTASEYVYFVGQNMRASNIYAMWVE